MTLRTVVNVTLMKYVLIGHSFFEPVLISSDAGSRSDSEGVSDIQVAGKTTIFERRKFDRNNDSDDCKDSLLRTPMKKNMLAMIMPKDCIVHTKCGRPEVLGALLRIHLPRASTSSTLEFTS